MKALQHFSCGHLLPPPKEWHREDGKLHREDGPAMVYENGTKAWFINGQLHRTDGPAIEYADGAKYWYQSGKLHRKDGPACITSLGTEAWWLYGKRYTKTTHRKLTRLTKMKLLLLMGQGYDDYIGQRLKERL